MISLNPIEFPLYKHPLNPMLFFLIHEIPAKLRLTYTLNGTDSAGATAKHRLRSRKTMPCLWIPFGSLVTGNDGPMEDPQKTILGSVGTYTTHMGLYGLYTYLCIWLYYRCKYVYFGLFTYIHIYICIYIYCTWIVDFGVLIKYLYSLFFLSI